MNNPGAASDRANGRLPAGRAGGARGRAGATRAGASGARGANGARGRRRARVHFLCALRELDDAWVAAFHRAGFGDVYFSRLFTELWLREGAAISKTDAYGLVKGVSAQTAMKYIRRAVAEGYLRELDNPADGRSRLLRMSPRLRTLFAQVIDRASAAFANW